MKHLYKVPFFFLLLIVSSLSQANTIGYYGDPTFDRVVAVNVEDMALEGDVSVGSTPYPVDRAGELNKIYAITRGENSIDVIDPSSLENTGRIDLNHKPRSGEAYNSTLDLMLVAGADKPMSSLINPNTDKVVAVAGKDELTSPVGFGGSLSSGHPIWLDHRKFAVIDRANRKIHLYKVYGNKWFGYYPFLLDTMETPTSVHSIVVANKGFFNAYYAVLEGAPEEGVHPGLQEFHVFGNKLLPYRKVFLDNEDASIMGSHHADLHPNEKDIYIGSTEGNMYVVDRFRMMVTNVIETGLGSGHTRFVPTKNLAVITNHKDTFVTVIDTNTHTKIADVTVSDEQMNGQILQSHTNYVDAASEYYYAFASDNGLFFELNLNTLEVERTLDTGGTPRQGVFLTQ